MRTKGQLEARISDFIVRFEKEYMGRGPLQAKTYIVDDIIVVRLKGILTPAEHQLAKTEGDRGCILIKQMRAELVEQGRPILEAIIHDITGVKVKSLHTDLSTATGERIFVFTLETRPQIDNNT